jgi:DNA topoisomerase-2
MAPHDKDIDAKYKKLEQRDHIYQLPDTYIGSIESTLIDTYVFDDASGSMKKKEITYVPGLYKIYDEVLVNAIDQVARLKADVDAGKKDVKSVKVIKITVNQDTGEITVLNDGDGIDVEKHSSYGDVWVPELIFGHLLTSTNYDPSEEKLWGGKNGFGAKLANIFSNEFRLETVDHRRQRIYKQTWKDNMKVKSTPTIKANTKAPYTEISFKPDFNRFGLAGITDDMFQLFRKRAYDACATTDASVSIYFNGEKLVAKDFEKYGDLYIGPKDTRARAYEACNDRWEVIATYSENGQFEQVSFVNGINTLRGGKHVEHLTNQITKRLSEMAAKKKKDVKQQHIKDNLFLLVKCSIVNPAFDSQTKETLTTQASKFGSKCDLSDKFFDKLYKTGILEKAISLTEFHDAKKMAKTDGKKTSRVLVPKLDDANHAGTRYSKECTLILTEGDSAKSMAIAGLSVVGRDKYGVFPLKGKIMNVKDADMKKILENEEITNLKKIIGLEQGKNYENIDSLRYGKIMLLTDADEDGSHIKGLMFNVFQSLWPSLYKKDGFLTSMLTPVIKATHSQQPTISFYNLAEFEKWFKQQETAAATSSAAASTSAAAATATTNGLRGWSFKYYKGLGTSTAEEAKEYFRQLKAVNYKYNGKVSDEFMDMAFNKKRSDDRKDWLMKYDRERILDFKDPIVPYEDFIDKDLIHFSNSDLERSIPHMCDGLKPSTRKILFGCFKKKLYTKEIRVAQLSGYISEVAAYHHGEKSLQDAIIKMAHTFVGTNNVNLLQPNGQFGTRIQGGSDAASSRYIHTLLSPLARTIFREEDATVLKYHDDDGMQVEPEYYIPIVPMVLINGGLGIGTGFSTNIPCHNPTDVYNLCIKIIDALDKDGTFIDTKQELQNANALIEKAHLAEIKPWYLGFQGDIIAHKEASFSSTGKWRWMDDNTVEVLELPVGTWTEDYKDFLSKMISDGSVILKDFESHYTDKKVKFVLKFYPGKRAEVAPNFETMFHLVSSKNLSINNIHLYNEKAAIQRFKTARDIVRQWAKIRLLKYLERKHFMLKTMDADHRILAAKVRFILDVISNKVQVMNKKMKDVEDQLVAMKYPKLFVQDSATTVIQSDTDEQKKPKPMDDAHNAKVDYAYLTRMPIHHLTFEKKQALEKEAQKLADAIKVLKATHIQHIWRDELGQFMSAWEAHRANIEKDTVLHVKMTDVPSSSSSPKSAKPAKSDKPTKPTKAKAAPKAPKATKAKAAPKPKGK